MIQPLSLMKFLILFYFLLLTSAQKAIILSSSIGYYNYRQAANAVKIYQDLKINGFSDSDILLFNGQISACCEKNPVFGTLSFHDGVYENIYSNVEVDYYYPEMHAKQVASIFSNQYPPFTLNKRRLILTEKQPLFIFVTGHGGDFYFKMREREALIDEQFAYIFEDLQKKNVTQSVVLLSDSCSAITPFETIKMKKFMAFASSSYDEKSASHGHDLELNAPKSDDFSFYLDEFLLNENQKKSQTFKDLEKYMDFEKLKVNAKMVLNGVKKSEKIDKYMKIKKEGKLKKFKGKNSLF